MKPSTQPASHTPTPWRVSQSSGSEIFSGDDYIAHTVQLPAGRVSEELANAALIVEAVNQHAALLAVVQEAKYLRESLRAVMQEPQHKRDAMGHVNWQYATTSCSDFDKQLAAL